MAVVRDREVLLADLASMQALREQRREELVRALIAVDSCTARIDVLLDRLLTAGQGGVEQR